TPRRLTVTNGMSGSLLLMVKELANSCAAVGVKRTVSWRLWFGAMVNGNAGLSTIEKGAAGSLMAVICRSVAPLLLIVTGKVGGVRTVPKSSVVGLTTITGFCGGGGVGVVTSATLVGSELPKPLKAKTR